MGIAPCSGGRFACGAPSPTIDAPVRSGIVVTLSAGQNGTGLILRGTYNAIPVGASFLDEKEAHAAGPFFTSAIGPLPDQRKYRHILEVENPFGLSAGRSAFEVEPPGSSPLISSILLGVPAPVLTVPYDIAAPFYSGGTGCGGTVQVQRNPGEAFGIDVSYVFGDTSLPGIVDLIIGGGMAGTIGTWKTGILDSEGIAGFMLEGTGAIGLSVGAKVFFQAVVFDLGLLQLVPSKVGTTLIVFPV